VIELRHKHECSIEQIAEMTGLSFRHQNPSASSINLTNLVPGGNACPKVKQRRYRSGIVRVSARLLAVYDPLNRPAE
jgi:hypothetical protein